MRPVPVAPTDPVPTGTSADQRTAERFGVGMPYTLASGMQGYTRDLSANGLSFDSDVHYAVGAIVQLTLRYGLDGHNFPMPCEVEVVRVDPNGSQFIVAARLRRPFFDAPA